MSGVTGGICYNLPILIRKRIDGGAPYRRRKASRDWMTAKQVTVREAQEEDVEALFDLHVEALRRHPEAFAAEPDQVEGDRNGWTGRLRRNSLTGMGTICLAESPEGIVAMSGIFRRVLTKMQHTASIWGMYVRPEWRGQGLGEQLLEANLAWARVHDVRIVRLAVVADNGPAIRCYLKQGFTVYGVEPEALYYDGRYLDELWMARRV